MGQESIIYDERIVISGVAGTYPQACSVKELSDILYNKLNPIKKTDRWQYEHLEFSRYLGEVADTNLFDSQFFKVNYHVSHVMDPMSRMLLEQTYRAIYDAGLCPEYFSGKKIGVFAGSSASETEKTCLYNKSAKSKPRLLGASKTFFANRISYWLNCLGPSVTIDNDNCSSITALELAYHAMYRGDCEAAIVTGSYLCLHPQTTLHYGRVVPLSPDGKTKSFDENANGNVMSEAVNILILQKAKDALRIYAEVVNVKTDYNSITKCKSGPRYGFIRDPSLMADFMKQFYNDSEVSPMEVEYVEAVGSGVPEADKAELEAIDEVYCKNRRDELLVGSVQSNIGNTVAASGISAITKVLLGYQTGKLAGNLHCERPRQDVPGIAEGRIRILVNNNSFRRTYAAVNNLSITGVNGIVLLRGYYKQKDIQRYKSTIPRLVTISSRQDSSVTKIFKDLKSRPVDPEEIALLHNIHENTIPGHMGRGFIVLDGDDNNNKTISLCEQADYYDEMIHPLWFVYSGMGSQWTGMGTQLMRIPTFAAAIERCRRVLTPKGIDIVHIITSTDKTIFDNILNSFVGIAAVQMGLTDVLKEIGLFPDKIIGHSVGELGCAYADGCLTAEEMILSAYYRGIVSLQTPFIHGSMAAVGLGYQSISKLCPTEIDIACHNGPESCTISGPTDVVRKFVDDLMSKGIFAKTVPTSNIAYHSRYIHAAGPMLLNHLKKIINIPKRRSERWLSSSVPQEQWTESDAKYSSAEYHTNNLLNPVLFEEVLRNVPSNAVVVEIAPHGLLQAILKRSLPESCHNVPLTRRENKDNAVFLLNSIGRLYMLGYSPKIAKLYPKVEYPVSTETPSLSHLVEMAHIEKWSTIYSLELNRTDSACYEFIVSVEDRANSYLKGHVIKDEMLYPFAGALVAAWDTLAMSTGDIKRRCSVKFQDVHLLSQPVLCERRPLRLSVTLQRGSGNFEVMNENSIVMTGKIIKQLSTYAVSNRHDYENKCNQDILKSRDIYNLLDERNHNYNGDFRSIHSTDLTITKAHLLWCDNWVTLIDGMLQLNVLKHFSDGVPQPIYIRNICIDVNKHIALVESIMTATIDETLQLTSCGGVSIQAIKFRETAPINEDLLDLKFANTQKDIINVNNTNKINKSVIALHMVKPGNFDFLKWVNIPEPQQSDATVTVHYAGLSQRDINRYITEEHLICGKDDFKTVNSYGIDFSGITQSGERVMGIVYEGTCCSHIVARPELLWPVPAHWSLEDAATVPLAYLQAFYCLGIKAQACPSMSILVHDGTSAFGQAVISIALAIGCQVFTTVDNIHKKHFLLKMFPNMRESHIGSTKDHTFKDMVLNATNGKGCDIVMCSVDNELKNVSLSCCRLFGITFDIVSIDRQESYLFGMDHLNHDRNYFTIDFNALFMSYDLNEMQDLQSLLSQGISRGYVRPLSRITFTASEAPQAFHLLSDSRHHGKVLLQLSNNQLPIKPKLLFTPYHNHIVFCNQQVFGIRLADALVKRGVRKLHIHYENPSAYVFYKIRSWEIIGVQVTISSAELGDINALSNLLNDISGLIQGVYYIGTATKGHYDNDERKQSLLLNLNIATRELCPYLQYFGVITNEDNNFELDICVTRAREELPATLLSFTISDYITNDDNYPGMDTKYCRALIHAMEGALTSPYAIFTVDVKPAKNRSFLQQIAAIAAINVPEDIDKVTTLGDLGVRDRECETISCFFRDHYNLFIKDIEISSLTIQKIQEIEDTFKKGGLKVENLLQQFYSHVDTDEMKTAVDVVPLPTLFDKSNLMYEEIDVSKTYLYIVPGLEGNPDRFRFICEGIKLPALVLIPGTDEPDETIQAMAQRLTKVVVQNIGIKDTFYLLGYENGMFVVLEMAAILEKYGISGTVFLLGCTPGEFQKIFNNFVNGLGSEEQLEDAILLHALKLIVKENTNDLEEALRETTLWVQKLELYIRALKGRTQHSIQYARQLVETALGRIKEVRRYISCLPQLRSKIVLLQSSDTETSSLKELQERSERPVDIHNLGSPLALATRDMNCSTIINEYLSTDMLEKFKRKNLCETYLIEVDNLLKL